jgi:soluble lytic murein transglycosylase
MYPKQGQVMDLTPVLDKMAVESKLQAALSYNEWMYGSGDGVFQDTGMHKPIINLEYPIIGKADRQVAVTVNALVLYEYITVYNMIPTVHTQDDQPELVPLPIYLEEDLAGEPAAAYDYNSIQYLGIIEKYSSLFGLDPAFVAATACAESILDETAVSVRGAVGIMQIMPSTGIWIAEETGMHDFHVGLLLDPDINIYMGCWYLSFLMDRFDGNLQTVAAAYNAGPSKVRRWLNDERYSSDGVNLHSLPYWETRNHIRKVSEHYDLFVNN